MRIISQDGDVDLPYESAVVIREEWIIRANVKNRAFCMGVYSTSEKALAVMEELRKKYEDRDCWNAYFYDYPKVFRFPPDGEAAP